MKSTGSLIIKFGIKKGKDKLSSPQAVILSKGFKNTHPAILSQNPSSEPPPPSSEVPPPTSKLPICTSELQLPSSNLTRVRVQHNELTIDPNSPGSKLHHVSSEPGGAGMAVRYPRFY
ncbi:hypothetical protein EMGBS15_09210 [Filimonas sp.]|nr:hypothetical protein EMGBS15_09210 [Filimonas sp.]